MELTADFSQRVTVRAAQLPWVASPIRRVDRCMLDCIGNDVARATSIVRYAPHSRFSAARVRWSGDPDRSPRTPFGISSPQFADLEGFCQKIRRTRDWSSSRAAVFRPRPRFRAGWEAAIAASSNPFRRGRHDDRSPQDNGDLDQEISPSTQPTAFSDRVGAIA
jgi:hypothetical protein